MTVWYSVVSLFLLPRDDPSTYLPCLGKSTPVWDKLVFSKIKQKIFGNRVSTIISGSAPLSTQVHEFLRMYEPYHVTMLDALRKKWSKDTEWLKRQQAQR